MDKKGEEFYQVSLGGSASRDVPASARSSARPLPRKPCADVIEKLIDVYIEQRTEDERFIDTYQRIGIDLFERACLCSESLRTTKSSTKPGTCCPRTSASMRSLTATTTSFRCSCGANTAVCSLARDGGLGIWLDADEEAEEIGEDVANFQVIA